MSIKSLSFKDDSAVPNMLMRELHLRFNQMVYIRQKYALKEPLNVEINYTCFPFLITVGSVNFVPEIYHQMPGPDRQTIDHIGVTASQIPGSIIARYFHPTGDMRSTLGRLRVLYPPSSPDNADDKLSEKYYYVRARRDDGTYEVVHEPWLCRGNDPVSID